MRAKEQFSHEVVLYLIVKDYKEQTETIYDNIDQIDKYLDEIYTKEELEKLLI